MALNGNALGDAIRVAIDALSDEQKASDREAIYRAMGTAIVSYLVVNTQVIVTNVTGVTTGGSTSGPGTGTIV